KRMSIQESIRLSAKGDIGLIAFDLPGEKVNKLSSGVMMRFQEVVDECKKSKFKALILISRKPGIFIAGADIDEIKDVTTPEGFRAAISVTHQIFDEFEDLPMPTI